MTPNSASGGWAVAVKARGGPRTAIGSPGDVSGIGAGYGRQWTGAAGNPASDRRCSAALTSSIVAKGRKSGRLDRREVAR